MNTALRNIVARTYKPLLVKYLAKTRIYRYKELRLVISPQVFHPGFFFSTKILLGYISKLSLEGKKFLELGCGSGLISIIVAKKGAMVTATDINPYAVAYLERNSSQHKVDIKVISSNLFQDIPRQVFDVIAINPPYYKKKPLTPKEHAWFCGEHGEYFSGLFSDLAHYTCPATEILMVLFEGCDMDMINGYAHEHGFKLHCVYSKQNLLEKNSVFKISRQL